MGICCAFIRLTDRNIEAMVRQPDLAYVLLGMPVAPRAVGFFARLLGRPAPVPPPPPALPDPREDDEGFDYLWSNFEELRAFLAEAHQRSQGLLVFCA